MIAPVGSGFNRAGGGRGGLGKDVLNDGQRSPVLSVHMKRYGGGRDYGFLHFCGVCGNLRGLGVDFGSNNGILRLWDWKAIVVGMSGENGISIIRRLIETGQGNLSPGAAQAILQIRFSPEDQSRVSELAGKSNLGTLSSEETEEYEAYIEAADVLSLWKSMARASLNQPAQV